MTTRVVRRRVIVQVPAAQLLLVGDHPSRKRGGRAEQRGLVCSSGRAWSLHSRPSASHVVPSVKAACRRSRPPLSALPGRADRAFASVLPSPVRTAEHGIARLPPFRPPRGRARQCGKAPMAPALGEAPAESPPHAEVALSLDTSGRRRAGRARGNGHGGGVRRRARTHRGEEGTGARVLAADSGLAHRHPHLVPSVVQRRHASALSSRSPGRSSGGTCPPTAPRRKR